MVSKTLIPFLFMLFIPASALAVSDAYQSLSMDLVVKAEDDISAERNAEDGDATNPASDSAANSATDSTNAKIDGE